MAEINAKLGAKTLDMVKDYYGNVLKGSSDLATTACCTADAMPVHLRPLVTNIHEEIREKFYGCGSPIPHSLEGATVLDLGCGTGRDCYLLSQLVGPKGKVIGIDMTKEQLDVARRHQDYHAKKFGFSNVEFRQGFIEDLREANVGDASVDLVVSNCVINLSPDKARVFSEIFRILKPGGELYFSDIFSDRRIPEPLTRDKVLLGECLSGALYIEDFRRMMREQGMLDIRAVSRSPVAMTNPEVAKKVGMIGFHSISYRIFKLKLEDLCEDYGQVGYYLGTIPETPNQFMLDDHHLFKAGMPMLICSNTAAMIAETRYKKHFKVIGDLSTHFGPFDCGPTGGASAAAITAGGGCC